MASAAALVRASSGCSGEVAAGPSGDAGPEATIADARLDRSAPEEEASYPTPFEGWDLYPDYDPRCEFYVPRSAAYLPPPIKWEPCRSNPETATKACRQMVFDWDPPKSSPRQWTTPGVDAIRSSNGRINLMTARAVDGDRIRFVADVDGPVHMAIRQKFSPRCALAETWSDGDYYAYAVYDSEAKGELSSYGGGAIGGRIGDLRPKTLKHYHDDVSRGFITGNPGLLELALGKMTLNSWVDGSVKTQVWSSAQDDGLGQNFMFFHGPALLWQSNTEVFHKLKVFTEAEGTKDLIGNTTDFTVGTADIGSDGKVLVWLEGSSRPQSNGVFPNVAIVTSPYTTDPTKLQRRVLRTDVSGYGFATGPFKVGCGYAARVGFLKVGADLAQGTMLIRLSDGAVWKLPDGPTADWGWRFPLAVTCDEIFVRVADTPPGNASHHFNVARVRIDSLGTPTPP